MLTSLMTQRYFTRIEKGLRKELVVDGPVHMSSGDSDEVIGKIEWYNVKTGFIRVKLFNSVFYKQLIQHGIEKKHIVFND
jgi:hypothetical protein